MGDADQDKELTDVILCYKAMGISIDDSPEQIERTYKLLTEEYRKNLASLDPAVRENARNSMVLVKEMYDKIKGSITYTAKAKECLKAGMREADGPKTSRAATAVKVEKSRLMNCPSCRSMINIGLKTCPICKTRIYSKTEKFLNQYFTKTTIIILCLFLLIGILAGLGIMYPAQVRALAINIADSIGIGGVK